MSAPLVMNKTINKNQFGFRKQKSCLNTVIAHGRELYKVIKIRRELYKVIDKLPKQESAEPGCIPSWALKDCKLSIGTHLQFAIIEFMKRKHIS